MRLTREFVQRVISGKLRPSEVLDAVREHAPKSARNNRSHPWWAVVGVEFFDAIEKLASDRPGGELTSRGIAFLSAQEAVREAFRVRGKVVIQLVAGQQIFRVLPVAVADRAITERILAQAMPSEMVEPVWDEELPTLPRFRQKAERQYPHRLIGKHGWNVSTAALEAGVVRQSLYSLLARHGLERPAQTVPKAARHAKSRVA